MSFAIYRKKRVNGHGWLTPIILATEAEIRRIVV
jgi:hypothetical protein